MKTKIILTGILKDKEEFLIVKRSEDDDFYPGAWEFPGGHLENGETLKDGLKRELYEEIGFNLEFQPIITHYYDEVKNKNGELIHDLEIDFIINVDKSLVNVILSVNDTIRMYKKRNITMYKNVHGINLKKYILFCYTLF